LEDFQPLVKFAKTPPGWNLRAWKILNPWEIRKPHPEGLVRLEDFSALGEIRKPHPDGNCALGRFSALGEIRKNPTRMEFARLEDFQPTRMGIARLEDFQPLGKLAKTPPGWNLRLEDFQPLGKFAETPPGWELRAWKIFSPCGNSQKPHPDGNCALGRFSALVEIRKNPTRMGIARLEDFQPLWKFAKTQNPTRMEFALGRFLGLAGISNPTGVKVKKVFTNRGDRGLNLSGSWQQGHSATYNTPSLI
jgi:hypothetical protein